MVQKWCNETKTISCKKPIGDILYMSVSALPHIIIILKLTYMVTLWNLSWKWSIINSSTMSSTDDVNFYRLRIIYILNVYIACTQCLSWENAMGIVQFTSKEWYFCMIYPCCCILIVLHCGICAMTMFIFNFQHCFYKILCHLPACVEGYSKNHHLSVVIESFS